MDINFSCHYLLRAGLMYRLSTFAENQLTINSLVWLHWLVHLWLLLFQCYIVNSYYIVLEHILNASKFIYLFIFLLGVIWLFGMLWAFLQGLGMLLTVWQELDWVWRLLCVAWVVNNTNSSNLQAWGVFPVCVCDYSPD